ncbi:MAG: hypothetical protein ACK5LK_09320 [Chthoniobacterales bacterium]
MTRVDPRTRRWGTYTLQYSNLPSVLDIGNYVYATLREGVGTPYSSHHHRPSDNGFVGSGNPPQHLSSTNWHRGFQLGFWAENNTLAQDFAQEAEAQAPEFGRWVINYTYKEEVDEAELNQNYKAAMLKMAENDPALAQMLEGDPSLLVRKPRFKQREIIKTGKIRSEQTRYTSGQVDQRWQEGFLLATHGAFNNSYSVKWISTEANVEPDFPELRWIGEKNFQGVDKVEGVECYIFEDRIDAKQIEYPREFAESGSLGGSDSLSTAKAAISVRTRLPVQIEYLDRTRTYEYPKPPTTKLKMPAEFVAKVREQELKIAERNKPLSAP